MNSEHLPEFSTIDELIEKLYKQAREELRTIERSRRAVQRKVAKFEQLLGISTAISNKMKEKRSAPVAPAATAAAAAPAATTTRKTRRKRPQIKQDALINDVKDILRKSEDQTLNVCNLLRELVENLNYPDTESFRTRLYSSMSSWAQEEDFLTKESRGVYRLVEEDYDDEEYEEEYEDDEDTLEDYDDDDLDDDYDDDEEEEEMPKTPKGAYRRRKKA